MGWKWKGRGRMIPHIPNRVGREIAKILAEQRRKREESEREEDADV